LMGKVYKAVGNECSETRYYERPVIITNKSFSEPKQKH